MSEQITGKVEVLTGVGKVTITLDGDSGDMLAGGNGQDGDLALANSSGVRRIHIDGQSGLITLRNANGEDTLTIGSSGNINIRRRTGAGAPKEVLTFDANQAALSIGGSGGDGNIAIKNIKREAILAFSAAQGTLGVGGLGTVGTIILRDAQERINLQLDSAGQLTVKGMGRIFVQNPEGKNVFGVQGDVASVWVGESGRGGKIYLRNGQGNNSISMNGESAGVTLGGGGTNGTIVLRNLQGQNTIKFDGKEGDIVLQNADCAEHFVAADPTGISPGTVVVLDEQGHVRPSMKPYDRKVVGVISGAGGLKPGIVLDHNPAEQNRQTVALVGKVYCKVDATRAAVAAGDLLTTAFTPGHAMKANDPAKAFGTVLGKALRPLAAGMELIPILVALQ